MQYMSLALQPSNLDLDRRVRDVKAMFDVMHDGAQHLLTLSDALLGN
jgi:hypothetical protein